MATSDVGVTGTADFTGGQAPVAPRCSGARHIRRVRRSQARTSRYTTRAVDGRALHADVSGTDRASGLDLGWHVALRDHCRAFRRKCWAR